MSDRPKWSQTTAVAARWALGGLFIYMGLHKVADPVNFLKLVREYHLVSSPFLLNVIAATLPWFEIFCGCLMILGIAVRGTALVMVAMLVPFTAMVWQRALQIAELKQLAFCAVKFDCGCGNGEVFICRKLVENSLMTLASVWLMFRPRQMTSTPNTRQKVPSVPAIS
jgi:uncharacterized membrane protein YphA (DoxX/SURF4 family)